jgi:signal transduction histidine kinase
MVKGLTCADTGSVAGQPVRARDRGEGDLGARGATERLGVRPRSVTGELWRVLAWGAVYVVATWCGNQTVSGDSDFVLFWPAAGVALTWIATCPRRSRPLELALVGALAAVLTTVGPDPSPWEAINGLVGVPLGLAVFLLVSRQLAPGLWGTGGTAEIATLRQYGNLVFAAGLAGLTEAAVASILLLPDPGTPYERTAEIAHTRTVAMAALGVTLLVIGGRVMALPARSTSARLASVRGTIGRRDLLLTAAGLAVTVLMLLAGYLWIDDAPVSFVLVLAVALVGIRYGAALTGFYALLVVVAACSFTVAGHGPLADIPEPHRRAIAFGVFTTTLVATGLTIALSRRERDTTIAALSESELASEILAEDLSLVLANLDEGVAVVEEGGRFLHTNPALTHFLETAGLNTERVEPVESYRLVHADGRPLQEHELPHARAFAGEEDVHEVLKLTRADLPGEQIIEVSARLLPQIRPTDPPRAVTTFRDVTIEHEQRDALASFAQVVAHDLRSPLTSIELWADELIQTLHEGPVEPELALMMLRHIESSAGRAQDFVADLLAYALARDQRPSPTHVELTDVIDTVVETIAAVEGTEPHVHYDDLPDVWCDPVLVPQLFDNLIGNARKYVAEGVVPDVTVEATSAGGWARVRVIDNGIGIAPEDRVRVFETFERARATEYEGTGLGLAICRHIVERHGGRIGVGTPPNGTGTCIELTLPTTADAFAGATTGAMGAND